ncbi:melanoma-associated antigen B17-like [Pipistrellus kuhlii]|uniref:melanoma-associated antigen B17-like n=1 Tax=Pipistrellus kuhlii TaxID=59472 RepID=UPI00174EE116|nr:melanoma-associated antigen B17-like [Pipistrellus kuhlii]
MPGRHKSKKCHRAQIEPQSCGNAQATAAAAKEFPPSFSTQCEGISQGLPVGGSLNISQGPQCSPTTPNSFVAIAGPESDKASSSQDEDEADSFGAPLSVVDDFEKRTEDLELFLLSKYKLKQPIMKKDMLHIVGKDYQDRFCEMLKKASDRMEILFALYINEVDSKNNSYALVSKLKLPNNGRVRPGKGFPKTGFLMHILSLIFMHGNCVSEEFIWKDLRGKKVYPGRKHYMFGDPKKLLTDFVRLKYLECHQVPHSDPQRSEFLWGPKAHLETSKMEVLEFFAKVNGTHPRAYPRFYEEALREKEERARAREAAMAATSAQIRASFRAMASTTFPPIEKSKACCPSHQNI